MTVRETLEYAASTYARRLIDSGEAKAFLSARRFTIDNAVRFRLGCADAVSNAQLQKECGDGALELAGLSIHSDGKQPYPRFRQRLVFPIADVDSYVVGFSGRSIKDAEPKYLNSPASDLFDKGSLLYNLDAAAPAARTRGRFVLVEGNFDVIRLAIAGVKTVVAPLGTALTGAQAELMASIAKVCYVCFDGDAAGMTATEKAGQLLLGAGVDVRVVELPMGHDPDSFVRDLGEDAIFDRLGASVDLLDWHIARRRQIDGFRDIARKRESIELLLAVVRKVRLPVLRTLYVDRVADVVGISRGVVEGAIDAPEPRPAKARRRKDTVPAWQRALNEAIGA